MAARPDRGQDLIDGIGAFFRQLLTPPPATSEADAGSPRGSPRSGGPARLPQRPPRPPRDYRREWIMFSDDPRFPLDALKARYYQLCDLPALPSAAVLSSFDAIERDVARTCVTEPEFQTQAGRNKLRRLLGAYAMHDPEAGYCQGLNFVAAFLLLHTADEGEAFVLFVRLLQAPQYYLRGCVLDGLPDVFVHGYVLKRLLWEHVPRVAEHLETVGCDPTLYFEWWFTMFTLVLPPDLCAEVWTWFFEDGWVAVYRVSDPVASASGHW